MSINVTVTGNPVSINRGKMITSSDPQAAKKEFDKRRLLRLEQVRQQSKELAEGVRNKVQREKKKQMGDIEREGKEKLKNWQNRKLLELQNQYLDALDQIGMGHKEAEQLADENEVQENERLQNEETAKNRGRLAETTLQVKKNEESFKKAMPLQHKKLVRDIENTRSALVSSMKSKNSKCQRKPKKSKPSANINITVPNDSDFSEASSSDSSKHLSSIQEHDQESEGFCECLESSEENVSFTDSDAIKVADNKRSHQRSKEHATHLHKKSHSERTKESGAKAPLGFAPQSVPQLKQNTYKESVDERRKLIDDFRSRPRQVPLDSRISDRIKRRQLMASQPDYCDLITDPTPIPEVPESTRIRDKILSRSNGHDYFDDLPVKDPWELSSDECMCTKFHSSCPCRPKGAQPHKIAVAHDLVEGYRESCKCRVKKESKRSKSSTREEIAKSYSERPSQQIRPGNISSERFSTKLSEPPKEIPSKPAVRLKDVEQPTSKTDSVSTSVQGKAAGSSGAYKVRHYDYPNRFVRDTPSTSHVEKIDAESIEVIPNVTSEAEWHEKMKQRDIDAQVRGKRALEKEKTQRDYEEMMKKLPMLQRKEHLSRIGTDKPEYHMSDERLKERERERQNRLENAYSKVMPDLKPQIVTIPSRKHEIPMVDEPFEILEGDDSRTLNLGKWDTDTKPKTMFSAEEVQEIIKAFTVQKPEDRKAKLKQLLKSLKLQKEQLINEIQALPRDDSINALLGDLNSFSDTDNNKHHRSSKHKKRDKGDKSERKRRLEESDSSTETSVNKSNSKSRLKEKYGRSPHKKMKKPVSKRLVLQNTSTQTTPKATKETSSSTGTTSTASSNEQEVLPKGIKICTKSHVPCDCYKGEYGESSEEVCKIYIKLNEEESPKVEVVRSARDSPGREVDGGGSRRREEKTEKSLKSPRKEKERPSKSPRKEKERPSKSPRKETRSISPGKENISPRERSKRIEMKSVATETDTFKKPSSKVKSTTQEKTKSPRKTKNESWKEHFSKNSMSTSSTSYMSPPDFSKPNTTASTEASKQSLYNLRRKPQQTNMDGSSTLRSLLQNSSSLDQQMNRKLLNYIQRLLSMSKTSVDDLGVSSSDVQTPSQSIIEIDSNNPLAALQNAIRFINSRAADIAKELSSSTDGVQAPPNSSANASDGSGLRVQQETPQPILDQHSKITPGETKESLLSQYANVTDSCTKRIANLAAMIEQLREEKIQMLEGVPLNQQPADQRSAAGDPLCSPRPIDLALLTPSLSDKDNSTKYFEFPPSGERSKGTNSNSTASMDEEELNRRLLEIDMSLADKLKTFQAVRTAVADQQQLDRTAPTPEADQQFLQRLQRLVQESHEREQLEPESTLPAVNIAAPFVPFLVDIPKLPILEPEPEGSVDWQEKRHPPPSKGLIAAKRFNGNISLVPHELSTIVEADSQVSTRFSPNNSKPTMEELSPNKSSRKISAPRPDKTADASNSCNTLVCNEGTCSSLASSSSFSHKSSSSSSSDMKSVEAMLKSIGMDWAIPTLHKTQEALALTSSSSSGDLSSKKKSGRRSMSTSETSLKEFLKKQFLDKVSSSSLNRSDASPASFVRECSEISAIQANSSAEKAKQRTSTPVLSSTSRSNKEEPQQLFTGASDLSSVRNSSCENSACTKSIGKEGFQSLAGDEDSTPTTKSSSEK